MLVGHLYLGRIRVVKRTRALQKVAVALLADPAGKHYGYRLGQISGVRSGVLYPILRRLLEDGWVEDGWEPLPKGVGRPARRYYELTHLGRRELGSIAASAPVDESLNVQAAW